MSTSEIITVSVVIGYTLCVISILMLCKYYDKKIARLNYRIGELEDKVEEFGNRYNRHLDRRH